MSIFKKITLALIGFFLAADCAIYAWGVFYYSGHFFPGTVINGQAVNNRNEEETEALLSAQVETYELTIHARGEITAKIDSRSCGYHYEPDGSVKALLEGQDKYRWFFHMKEEKVYEIELPAVFDAQKLSETVSDLSFMQAERIEEPQNASISETDTGYEILPEVLGNQPKVEKVHEVIASAVAEARREIDLEAEDCYVKPSVYRDDERLLKDCACLNRITGSTIIYDFGWASEKIDKNVIKEYLVRKDVGVYDIDRRKLAAYVKQLADWYDTYGEERLFQTYDGRELSFDGTCAGWEIDQEAETEALYQMLLAGESQENREPIYRHRGLGRDGRDFGTTYVEIDLSAQRLLYFKDGELLVDTKVITGNPNEEGCETPTGVFAIRGKRSPAVVWGEDYPSEVTYWMPFAGKVGIHDAPWLVVFGGDFYQKEGSHGCVNLPSNKARILYENIEVGVPVLVYK